MTLYKQLASEPGVQRFLKVAKEEKVPIAGIPEPRPAGKTSQDLAMAQLASLDTALAGESQ